MWLWAGKFTAYLQDWVRVYTWGLKEPNIDAFVSSQEAKQCLVPELKIWDPE